MSELTACLYGFTDKLDFIPSYNSQQCFLEKPDFVPTFNSQQCFRSLKTEEQSLIITFSYSSICFCLPGILSLLVFIWLLKGSRRSSAIPFLENFLIQSVDHIIYLRIRAHFQRIQVCKHRCGIHWYCYKLHFDCNYVTVQHTRLCLKKWNKQQQSINS